MIYCVVPQALADELYDKLVEYYREDPNVEVIIDRRSPGAASEAEPRPGSEAPARRERDRPREPSAQDVASENSAVPRRA